MTRIAVNDVSLNVEVRGEGPPLLLLHGFTGSAATWTPFAEALRGYTTVAVDLLGHGRSDSPENPARYAIGRCIDDLSALLDALGMPRAAVLGYSMGGRVALRFALAQPERVAALTLESASSGIDSAAEREARIAADEALAQMIERDGLEAFVAHWQSIPLFASQSALPAAARDALRAQRLLNSPVGLANSLRGMGAGRELPALDRLPELRMPVRLIVGALDAKYCALAERMAAALPNAAVDVVPDAGHTVHLEQPEAFARIVREFLHGAVEPGQKREPVA